MNKLDMRTYRIRHRLADYVLNTLGCAAVTPSKTAWTTFEIDGPYRFGWMPPTQIEDDSPLMLIVSFCPELIAETTLWLDKDQLDQYLSTIEAFIDAMVTWPERSESDVYGEVQDKYYTMMPEVLALVSQVEARAIDEGVVAGASSST